MRNIKKSPLIHVLTYSTRTFKTIILQQLHDYGFDYGYEVLTYKFLVFKNPSSAFVMKCFQRWCIYNFQVKCNVDVLVLHIQDNKNHLLRFLTVSLLGSSRYRSPIHLFWESTNREPGIIQLTPPKRPWPKCVIPGEDGKKRGETFGLC